MNRYIAQIVDKISFQNITKNIFENTYKTPQLKKRYKSSIGFIIK